MNQPCFNCAHAALCFVVTNTGFFFLILLKCYVQQRRFVFYICPGSCLVGLHIGKKLPHNAGLMI